MGFGFGLVELKLGFGLRLRLGLRLGLGAWRYDGFGVKRNYKLFLNDPFYYFCYEIEFLIIYCN